MHFITLIISLFQYLLYYCCKQSSFSHCFVFCFFGSFDNGSLSIMGLHFRYFSSCWSYIFLVIVILPGFDLSSIWSWAWIHDDIDITSLKLMGYIQFIWLSVSSNWVIVSVVAFESCLENCLESFGHVFQSLV